MSKDKTQLHVLIVGGGIGGLTAAIALRLQGHRVEVFEKMQAYTELGNAIHSAPNCTVVLQQRLGITFDTLGAVPMRGISFFNAKCDLVAHTLYSDEQVAGWPAEWYTLNRKDLHAALITRAQSPNHQPSNSGPPVTLHTASQIKIIDPFAPSITLVDGTTHTADLVVGADGVYSKARAAVVGHDVKVEGTGQCCYRTMLPTSALRQDPEMARFVRSSGAGSAVQIAGTDRMAFLYPCASGEAINLVVFVPRSEVGEIKKALTGYDQKATKDQLKSHFSSFAPAMQHLLDKAPEDSVKLWDLVDMESQPRFVRDRAVLIGDAAHPFLPFMGQGAAQAIEDGCALGVVLPQGTAPEEIPERLELWQKLRMERVHRIVEHTRHRGRKKDGSQGPPQTVQELQDALHYCVHHDSWAHAEEGLKSWLEQRTHRRAADISTSYVRSTGQVPRTAPLQCEAGVLTTPP